MDNTPTREELKAILDEWIPKYIRQVVELRSGGRLSAERYNELMNLLITQGDDTIELAETVKQYVEILVEETETEFELTTETVTNLANNAVSTANNAVNTVEEFKTVINRDITAFKEAVNQVTDTANSNASLALQTANQLVIDMEDYRSTLSTQVEETFTNMRNVLGAQVTDEVGTQMQGIQEALTADINTTIDTLSEEVLTIANTAEQSVNSAIQDIETYKADMDTRLDDALKEVEESLSAAGDIIRDASAIYAAIDNKVDIGELEAHTGDNAVHITADERTAWNQNATDVSNIVNGTTPVGNALQLGGKSASEYALAETLTQVNGTTSYLNTSILEKALEVTTGVHNFRLGGGDYTGTDLPDNNYAYGMATIFKRSSSFIMVVIWGRFGTRGGKIQTNYYDNTTSTWTGWDSLFTTSGGTITGTTTPLVLNNENANGETYLGFRNNGTVSGFLGFSANGNLFMSKDGSSFTTILHTGNSAKIATSGKYSDLSGTPSSLPASDVYSWAKASAKPSYTWSEITSKPTSFTPASHNQAASTITAGTLAGKVQANASAASTVTNAQVRDIYAGTSALTANSSSLTTGTIYVQYE